MSGFKYSRFCFLMAWLATDVVGLTYRETEGVFKFRMHDASDYLGVADTRAEALRTMRNNGFL